MCRLVPLFTLLLVLLLLATPALSATRLGSDAGETLIGTNKADRITGGGGNDTLKGLAGNDTYYFANGCGSDTLEEMATYKVGGKKKPGGRDTLSFRGLPFGVSVTLVPEWAAAVDAVYNSAFGDGGACQVDLDQSIVENVVGSPGGSDFIATGGEADVLASGGGGTIDILQDFGGWPDGEHDFPGLPSSNDIFRDVATNTGTVSIIDVGGTADVLDLRPLSADQVYLAAVNCDDDAQRECLQIVTGNGNGEVLVQGQFGEFHDSVFNYGNQGRIEVLRFSDGDVRLDDDVTVSAAALRTGSLTGERLTRRQQREAERAPALLEDALRELETQPEPGTLPSR